MVVLSLIIYMPHDFRAATVAPSMTAQFLKRLLARFCRHRFSWPHTGLHGQDYQVCLDCGATYGYDCTTMQRTGRLTTPLTADMNPYRESGPTTSEVAADGSVQFPSTSVSALGEPQQRNKQKDAQGWPRVFGFLLKSYGKYF